MAAAGPDNGAGELVLYLGLGQSLLALVPRLRPLGEAPGPVDPARAWVFAPTGDPRVARDPTQDLPDGSLAEPWPHLRHRRSGPLTAASAVILDALGPQDRLVSVNLARRNSRVSVFLPGGAAFRNVERCLRRAADLAAERGLVFRRLVVSWVQGQADSRTPHATYLQQLGTLVDALEAAIKAVTDGHGWLTFCLSQTTATYVPGRRGVPLAQLELAEERAGQVILAGPDYMLERSDGVHLKPRSAVRLGVLHGRSIRSALNGGALQPLRMVEAVVTGSEVRVGFAGGQGDLVVAPSPLGPAEQGVRPLPNLGFAWEERRGGTVRVISARISGPREVTLALSQAPESLERSRITLGFPQDIGQPEGFVQGDPSTARGAATNLCSASAEPDVLGQALAHWALQQRIAPRWSQTA